MLSKRESQQAPNAGIDHCLTQSRGYTPCIGMDPCVEKAIESRAYSANGMEKDARWSYVGEAAEALDKEKSREHSRLSHRLWDEPEEHGPLGQFQCDRRERCLCCLLFFLVLVCSGLLAAYMALSSSNAPSSLHWGRAPSLPWLPWASSPSTTGAPARSAVTPSAVVDSMSAEPYDCADQYRDWESMWTDTKMAWCCRHEQKGCTKATTSAAASPPQTRSHETSRSTAGALRQPTSTACMASCTFDAQTATCGQRVQFAAEYVFFAEARPCREAHDLVLKECSVCSDCMLDATGCELATE